MNEPYDHGMLDVGDGQRIRWDVRGNPSGTPAVVVHGGPGPGASTGPPRDFDPQRYRLVMSGRLAGLIRAALDRFAVA